MTSQHVRRTSRSGFTLTEMLVATALVLLIMTMFAELYSSAIGTISTQRALANNDQKARITTTLLRQDFQNLTYRQPGNSYGTVRGIVPISPGDEPILDPAAQQGILYFSENDPNNHLDDVLHFTSKIRVAPRGDSASNRQQRGYMGLATNLGITNEPDYDDGNYGNNLGTSRAAEIVYFVRGRSLYRRVFLIRDPLDAVPAWNPQPSAPVSGVQQMPVFGLHPDALSPNYTGPSGNFYSDFDYAATRRYVEDETSPGTYNSYLWFHSLASLKNGQSRLSGYGNDPTLLLAFPPNRFGFLNSPGDDDHGMPREYLAPGSTFIGRMTSAETSDTNFGWPGLLVSRFDRNDSTYTDTYDLFDNVIRFSNANPAPTRVGEDLLLTNVEGFDIEIWDSQLQGFRSLQNGVGGDFSTNGNPNYGPNPAGGNEVFDTWYPNASQLTLNSSVNINPPYRQFRYTNPQTWSAISVTLNDNIPDIIPIPALNTAGLPNPNISLVYMAVRSIDGSTNTPSKGAVQPEFPPLLGNLVRDGNVLWQCIDNRVGLRAIRITLRYLDVGSGIPRQVSFVHSFVE